MGTAVSTISLSEFSNLPKGGVKHEVDAGELLTLPFAKSLHTRIARLVGKTIEKVINPDLFEVFVEAGYLLCSDPLTLRQPDVSVLSQHRIAKASADSYFEGAPELAIEIVSPTDTADNIQTKVRQYLQYGALQVWVLYPRTRDIHVFSADSKATILSAEQILEGGPVLPGFAVPVGQLFAV